MNLLPITFCFLSCLISSSLAVPIHDGGVKVQQKRSPQNVYPQGPSDAVVLDIPSATAVPPPTASGGLYGDEALLGYDGNPVSGSAVVEDYQLVPGQLADPIEGLEVCISYSFISLQNGNELPISNISTCPPLA